MSTAAEPDGVDAEAVGRALAEGLSSALPIPAQLEPLAAGETETSIDGGALEARARCPLRLDPPLAAWLILPAEDAATLAAIQQGDDKELVEERRANGFDSEQLDPLQELLRPVASALWQALGREPEPGAELEIEVPVAPDPELPADMRRIHYRVVFEGLPECRLELRLPALDEGDLPAPLIVIEADEQDRAAAAELAEGLGRPVWALDPHDVGADLFPRLAGAAAIVVGWDLGNRAGLDVVEELRIREYTALVPLAMCASEATRSRVQTALRAGARTFLIKPLDADQLRARLPLDACPAEDEPADAEEVPE